MVDQHGQLSFADISPRLPSRYEDLDAGFKGSLRPNENLIEKTKAAFKSIAVTGGIRFLPIFGLSGSGKSCATLELSTHLPEIDVVKLESAVIEDPSKLGSAFSEKTFLENRKPLVAVVDQFEEAAKGREQIPTQFVEKLAALDASFKERPVLVIWLTTSEDFRDQLVAATKRRSRILVEASFEIVGPARSAWAEIISDTFSYHNSGRELADFEILDSTIDTIATDSETIGSAIEGVARKLADASPDLVDLSDYQVVMLWPVTDGQRIQTLNTFSSPRQGYKVNWYAFYNQLNSNDKKQLPLEGLNKARLYFDLRLVPIAAADLAGICTPLNQPPKDVIKSSIDRFQKTHLVSVIAGGHDAASFSPLRERSDSRRGRDALEWYKGATRNPVGIGKQIANALKSIGIQADHEQDVRSPYSTQRADVLVRRSEKPTRLIVELKAYSPENTRPSDVSSQIRSTLTKLARFAGFIERQ